MRFVFALLALALPAGAHDDWHRGRILYWYDGDTPQIVVYGFMGSLWEGRARIRCIDTPEIRPLATREIATVARDYATSVAPPETEIIFKDHGTGGRGRPVIDLYVLETGELVNALIYQNAPETGIEAYNLRDEAACREFLK